MKNITLIIAFTLFFVNNISGKSLPESFQILPNPQKIEVYSPKGLYGTDLLFIVADSNVSFPVLGYNLDRLPQCKKKGKGVYLKISQEGTPDSDEGYILEVNTDGVVITAKALAGLFYGCQTLEQLIEDSYTNAIKIPLMKITDYPALSYRAVHLDTKNHLDRIEYYYRTIDKLSRYKINAIIWEIEDKLGYTRRPEIASPNAISKQEMAAICRYANERNIEISPLVQGLGHAGFILKHHWELRENLKSDWEFCPSNPKTYELQFDLYRDAIDAMPYSKYLHVGGDEITAIGIDDRCKSTGKTAFELQMMWLEKVCNFAIENNKTPIFWDDMPLKYAGLWDLISNGNLTNQEVDARWNTDKLDQAIDLFPKECIYMRWNYGDATTYAHKKILKWYKDKGLKIIGATGASTGDCPVLPRKNSKVKYIQGFNQLANENDLEGILATAWDDGSPHLETVWRGYIAQGEFGWNPSGRTLDQFKLAHAQREFGFNTESHYLDFLEELEIAASFYDEALVSRGRRNPAWGVVDFKLIDLPQKNDNGKWCLQYENKIEQAKIAAKRYFKIKEAIDVAKKEALRNRYTLEIYEQINTLLYYPSQLILALSSYDSTIDIQGKKKEMDQIILVCNAFNQMREELESVYSQTRFMQNPEGYISDLNHHNHLASKTNNSDWMYLYEIPMIKKILLWSKESMQK